MAMGDFELTQSKMKQHQYLALRFLLTGDLSLSTVNIYLRELLISISKSTMSFGYGVGDFLALSTLALNVYTAYVDAPGDYKNISEEVKSLHIIIEEGAQHFERTILSCSQQQKGKDILQGCQSVLEDLGAFIEKYKSLASTNKNQIFTRVKLGMKDITPLRTRLISNTILLNGFIQRFVVPDPKA